jgi:hypoxanthine phosphoribosyltransferase
MELTLFTEERIRDRIKSLANEIYEDHKNSDPLIFVCILRGSFLFFADLIREIKLDVETEFIQVSSYENEVTAQSTLTIKSDIKKLPENATLILVDDIVDTGRTLEFLSDIYKDKGILNIKTVSLICRPSSKNKVDYYGFEIGDEWIYGYGMDMKSKKRNLKEIKYFENNID